MPICEKCEVLDNLILVLVKKVNKVSYSRFRLDKKILVCYLLLISAHF